MSNSDSKLICRLCGEVMGPVVSHLFHHNYEVELYMDFFEAQMSGEEVRRLKSSIRMTQLNNQGWNDTNEREVLLSRFNASKSRLRPDVSEINRKQWLNPEYRSRMVQMSRDNFQKVLQGWRRGRKLYESVQGFTVNLRSSWEVAFAILLDVVSVKWNYETVAFKESNGGWYIPDFWLPEFNIYVEVKCLWSSERVIEVLDRISGVEQNADVRIVVIAEDELSELDAFSFLPIDYKQLHVVTCDMSKFNDYPCEGSTLKRAEVRRNLEALLGSRYSLVSQVTGSSSHA